MANEDRNAPAGGRDPNRDDMEERGIGSADDMRGIARDEEGDEFEETDDLEEEDEEDDEGVV